MARKLRNWYAAYNEFTEDTESPLSFHIGTAAWTLAGALQRKVWLEFGHWNIFPNVYIVLVAPAGKARKTAAIRIGSKMLTEIGVPLVADNITREGLIRQAATEIQQAVSPSGIVYPHNSLSLPSEEFVVFLGQNNFQMIDLLTDWFDCKSPWKYVTKGQGTDVIEGLFFNLIGAATSEGLGSHLPEASIGGGFTSRIVFIAERDKRKNVAIPKLTERQKRLGIALTEDLAWINQNFFGVMQMSQEAMDYYEEWYCDADRDKGVSDARVMPYLERKPLHVLKFAMGVHFSSKDNMWIDAEDIDTAIKLLNSWEPNMPEAFTSIGLNKSAGLQEKVVFYISRFNAVSHEDLQTQFWRDADGNTLGQVLKTLSEMGALKTRIINGISHYSMVRKQ